MKRIRISDEDLVSERIRAEMSQYVMENPDLKEPHLTIEWEAGGLELVKQMARTLGWGEKITSETEFDYLGVHHLLHVPSDNSTQENTGT